MTVPTDKTQPGETEPTRRNRPTAISGGAGQIGRNAFVRMGFSDPTLVLRWREIAGSEVARLCQPIRFAEGPNGGTLTLKALPGAAIFLGHETRSLAARINQYLGRPAVSRLKFVHGTLARARSASPLRRPAADTKPDDPAELYDGPVTLKEALKSLARWRQGAQTGAKD